MVGISFARAVLALGVAAVLALASPTVHSASAADERAAMSVEQTEATLTAFLDAVYRGQPYDTYFADDVAVSLAGGTELAGRKAATLVIGGLLDVTFEASGVITSVVVGAGHAATAAESGASVDTFVRPAPTVGLVTTPYVIFYDLADEHITALRIYGLPSGFVQQLLTGPAVTGPQGDVTRYRPGQPH